jgi:hypothetical protein
MMFDKTPHAMALLGTFQQECAEAIGAHQWNRFQLEICQKGTITVGNLVRARYLEIYNKELKLEEGETSYVRALAQWVELKCPPEENPAVQHVQHYEATALLYMVSGFTDDTLLPVMTPEIFRSYSEDSLILLYGPVATLGVTAWVARAVQLKLEDTPPTEPVSPTSPNVYLTPTRAIQNTDSVPYDESSIPAISFHQLPERSAEHLMRQGVATKQGVYALYTTYLAVRKAIADKQLNTANVLLVNEYVSNMTHVKGSISPMVLADELIYEALWFNLETVSDHRERMRAIAWLVVAEFGKEHAAYLLNYVNGTSWPLSKMVAVATASLMLKYSPEPSPE